MVRLGAALVYITLPSTHKTAAQCGGVLAASTKSLQIFCSRCCPRGQLSVISSSSTRSHHSNASRSLALILPVLLHVWAYIAIIIARPNLLKRCWVAKFNLPASLDALPASRWPVPSAIRICFVHFTRFLGHMLNLTTNWLDRTCQKVCTCNTARAVR